MKNLNPNDVTGLLSAIVTDRYPDETEAFAASVDDWVRAGLQETKAADVAPLDSFEFGPEFLATLQCVTAVVGTLKALLEIRKAVAPKTPETAAQTAERALTIRKQWVESLVAAKVARSDAEAIADKHVAEFVRIASEVGK